MKTAGTGDQSGGIGVPDTTQLPQPGTGNIVHALVVAGGSIATTTLSDVQPLRLDNHAWLRREAARARIIIGADAGAGHLWACGVRPDLVVGDLDSLDQ
ncbi:MAG: hypothetical protein KGR25_08235, partial [Chloroflexi bacterium]|nr:hypothetical protein [Chloroflexota bacterium]